MIFYRSSLVRAIIPAEMKILVVCQFYYPETFSITSICEGWAKQGHDVQVVTGLPNYGFDRILEGYENIHDEVINGVRVHRCKLYPRGKSRMSIIKNYLSFWKSSKKYIRHMKEEFDVVYSMSLSPIISVVGANIYAKKHHVPHVLHCLDLWPESTVVTHAIKKNSLLYRVLYLWSKSIYKKADKILISSPSFKDYFSDVLKLDTSNIAEAYQPPLIVPQKGEDIKYDHAYNIVYAGNIGSIQMVEELTKAMVTASKECDVALHLIGMGTKQNEVQNIVQENHLKDRVFYYGPKARAITTAYFKNATALVVTLREGGFVGRTIPNKLTSSLHYGRPILACITGDGRKVLEESQGAVFAENETAESLSDAIIRLCKMSENERNTLGKNNEKYFEERYAFDKLLDRITSELESAKKK